MRWYLLICFPLNSTYSFLSLCTYLIIQIIQIQYLTYLLFLSLRRISVIGFKLLFCYLIYGFTIWFYKFNSMLCEFTTNIHMELRIGSSKFSVETTEQFLGIPKKFEWNYILKVFFSYKKKIGVYKNQILKQTVTVEKTTNCKFTNVINSIVRIQYTPNSF